MYSTSCKLKLLYLILYSSILYSLLEVSSSIDYCNEQSRAFPLIHQGKHASLGDSPWHVAVYDMRKCELICGGTIVSPTFVISAGHCFFNETTNQKTEASNYEIVTGKIKREYNSIDSEVQKAYKLKEIRFRPDKPYSPFIDQHASDIAALILEKPIQFSELILPACIDWARQTAFIPTGKTDYGQVAGWGRLEKHSSSQPSDTLQTANLRFVNYTVCKKKIQTLDFDKFCAGTDEGVGTTKGDSGGGLLFKGKDDDRYYLRGIVSTSNRFSTYLSTFTDLTYHIEWLAAVNQEIADNETMSLFQAAETGQLRTIQDLIQNSREYVNLKNKFNMTVLHFAALNNHITVLEYLTNVAKAVVNVKGYDGQTPLHMAAQNGHLNAVKYLIEKKADIHLRDDSDDTVLHYAAGFGRMNVLTYLIEEKRCAVDVRGYNGRTPLHYAARNGFLATLKYLIKMGANINLADHGNNNVLHYAAYGGYINIVEYLINERNIDVNMRGGQGLTALQIATNRDNSDVIKFLTENNADDNPRYPESLLQCVNNERAKGRRTRLKLLIVKCLKKN